MKTPASDPAPKVRFAPTLALAKLFSRFRKPSPSPLNDHLPALKEIPQDWWLGWDDIREAYPVGHAFKYLGRLMIVTRLRGYRPGWNGYAGYSVPPTCPAVLTEYVDDHGLIRSHIFEASTWPILIAITRCPKPEQP